MTIKPICALCPSELTEENKTKEHIIPNSIGGWEKVEGFICLACNSGKGETWDAVLASQFNWLAVMLGIVRDRKESPPELVTTASGEKFMLRNDGTMLPAKFKYNEVKEGEKTTISFVARTTKEATKKIEEIAKRFPQVDKEEALANAKIRTSYLDEPLRVQLDFGGPLAGRSVVNTALAFAFLKGIAPYSCENVKDFLHDENAPSSCYGLSYLKDIVKDRPANTIFHCVAIRGEKSSRSLLAYVEYFGMARWLIVLSNNFDGPDIKESYAIDPTTAEAIDVELDWALTNEIVEHTINGYGYTDESYFEAITKSLDEIMRRSNARDFNNAIKTAFQNAGEKLGLTIGDQITPDHCSPFASVFVEELTPFILHRIGIKST